MRKKPVLLSLLACLAFIFICVPLQSADTCKAPPPEGPPPDNADDNFSFNLQGANIKTFSPYIEKYPFIGILNNGNVDAMEKLLIKIGRYWVYVEKDFNPVDLMKTVNLLIIPTGGLFGIDSASLNFRLSLEQYVCCGGSILCFAQQYSGNFLGLPAGESLNALGWRNSQSCYQGSIYFSQPGPIFTGQTSQHISAGVGGGFNLLTRQLCQGNYTYPSLEVFSPEF